MKAPIKKVLVTGAGGFIGKRLCKLLAEQHFDFIEHHSSDSNISDSNALNKYNGLGVTDVIHLAAKTFVPDSWNDIDGFLKVNVQGTQTVLDFCRNNRARLVFCSAYLYGNQVANPIKEDSLILPNNPYALSKKLAEDLCIFYQEYFKLEVKILRPFNVYGPGQREEFLLPLILRQIKQGNAIRVKDLFPKRDYIYVDDLANAFIAALRKEKSGIYNVGSGKSTSVEELISICQNALSTQLNVISENTIRPNEISDTVADINNIRNELGWEPKTSLQEGIRNTFSTLQ